MAEAKAVDHKPATLQQKFMELRKAVMNVSDKVTVSDIYQALVPAMNEQGVNLDIVEEAATKHDQNGDDKYITNYTIRTSDGDQVVWAYEADITIRWTNTENPKDSIDVKLHAIGTNRLGPDKAKGVAWSYCLKWYFIEKFGIWQGAVDPDCEMIIIPSQSTQQATVAPQANTGQSSKGNAGQGAQQTQSANIKPLSD